MNVILVVFDTLRRDACGAYGAPAPWGAVATPNLDAFARESVTFTRAYPESLPTLCARRALYTGQRTYPFHNGNFRLKGDFVPAPGWGPIPEEQDTLAELFSAAGYRTGLISDLYHQFKPSKNFWRGFDEWRFIRGQETDPARSGPAPTQDEIDYWAPREIQAAMGAHGEWFARRILLNMRDRVREEQWFNAQVMQQSSEWLSQNQDAERFFLTVESFDPHEPWFVPPYYRLPYDAGDGPEQVVSPYAELPDLPEHLVRRTRANYAGLVTMCDRWFGHLIASLRVQGLLENSVVVVTSDHGHSLWERRGYIGKRGYPSDPEVVDTPLFIRHPGGLGAGATCDAWVQHHDIAATLLDAAGVSPRQQLSGRSVWGAAFRDEPAPRDHVTVGWGSAMTVINDRWWFNCKVNGRGALLFDRTRADPFGESVAVQEPELCRRLFEQGVADGGGSFPEYLLAQAESLQDAPGCSPLTSLPL